MARRVRTISAPATAARPRARIPMGKRSDELDRTDPPAPVAGAPMGIADVGVVVAADDVIPKFVVETPDVVVVVGAVEVVDPTAVVVVVPPTTVVVEVVPPTAVVVPPTAVVVVVVDPTAVVVPQTVVVVVGFVVVVLSLIHISRAPRATSTSLKSACRRHSRRRSWRGTVTGCRTIPERGSPRRRSVGPST